MVKITVESTNREEINLLREEALSKDDNLAVSDVELASEFPSKTHGIVQVWSFIILRY